MTFSSPEGINLPQTKSSAGRTICQNPACRKEIEPVNDETPRCTCLAVMKKVYTKPAVYRLTPMEAKALGASPGLGGHHRP
jgi:hypothetical protein